MAGSASLTGCISLFFGASREKLQKRLNQTATPQRQQYAPISFPSQQKQIQKTDTTVVVHNRAELVAAITKPGATVWIPENVTISMKRANNPIAPNVTIASNRQSGNGTGGLITTDDYLQNVFVATGPCRVTGLRVQGPETTAVDPPDKATYRYASSCFHFTGQTAIVDNCEVFGWPGAGVIFGTQNTPTQGWIHHNEMHHNQMTHLGYAIELHNGLHLVEWNYFANYQHAITGYGYASNGYEARFNVVGPPGGAPRQSAFDMPSLGEHDDVPASTTTAGKYVNTHHNVFELTDEHALSMSGIPTKYARFVHNWCATANGGEGPGVPAVFAPKQADIRKQHNHFGNGAVAQGRQWLQQAAPQIPVSGGTPSLEPWSPPQKATTTAKKRPDKTATKTRTKQKRNEKQSKKPTKATETTAKNKTNGTERGTNDGSQRTQTQQRTPAKRTERN